jgi:hypothetical protein
MANQKKFEAAIEIGGRINRSFNNSVDKASKGFGSLERAGNKAATGIDRSFAHLGARIKGRFVGSIMSSTKAMGAMAAKSVAAMGAMSAAYLGFRSVSGFFSKSIDEFVENVGNPQKLEAALRNNPDIAKQGEEAIQAQIRGIGLLSEKYQNLSAIKKSVFQGAFETLAPHAGIDKMRKLAPGIADYLAFEHQTNATVGDAQTVAKRIIKAVQGGQLGRFADELGLLKDERKHFEELRTSAGRIDYLVQMLQKYRGGQYAKLADTVPGKLALKQYKANQLLDRYGKQLIQIKDKWQEISYQILTALEPALSPTVNAIKGAFDWVVKLIEKLKSPEVVGVWKSLSGVFSEIGKGIAAISVGSAEAFSHGGALANAARSFRDLFSEKRYDWASKLQPQTTFGGFRNEFGQSKSLQGPGWQAQNFRMNSGLPQLKGFGDRQFNPSSFMTPDYRENVFTKLRWDFESFGEYIKSMLPSFKKFGENMGLVAAMNFEAATLAFKTLENTTDKLGDAFNGLKKIADDIIKAIGAENVKKIGDFTKKTFDDLSPTVNPVGWGVPFFMPGLADGGIVRKPHVSMVGEAGPEAIIPLKRGKRSLGLLDAAAGAMGVGAAPSSPTIHKIIVIKPTINITGVDAGTAQRVADNILSLIKEAAEDDYSTAVT